MHATNTAIRSKNLMEADLYITFIFFCQLWQDFLHVWMEIQLLKHKILLCFVKYLQWTRLNFFWDEFGMRKSAYDASLISRTHPDTSMHSLFSCSCFKSLLIKLWFQFSRTQETFIVHKFWDCNGKSEFPKIHFFLFVKVRHDTMMSKQWLFSIEWWLCQFYLSHSDVKASKWNLDLWFGFCWEKLQTIKHTAVPLFFEYTRCRFSSVRGLIFHIDRLKKSAWGVSSHSWSQTCRRTPAAGVIHNAGHCSEVTFITCCAMISFLNMRERALQSHGYGNASNMIHLFPKAEPNPTWLTRASLESIDLTWQSGENPAEWIMLKHTSGSSVWLCRKTSVQHFLL